MFKKTALVAGIGLALSVTAQADYRWELGGDYTAGQISADVKNNRFSNKSDDIDENIGRLYGTWYMENVDTSKGPLGEAAFLDHASNVTIFGTDGEVDLNSLDRSLQDQDGQTYGIDTRYVAEGPGWKLSGWLVDLGYERREPGDAEIDFYNIGLGKYITPNTTLVFNYETVEVNDGGDTDGYAVDLEHFFAFNNGGFKANLSAGKVIVKEADDVDSYEVGGKWYLNNHFGFGAAYKNTAQNGREVDGFKVDADWFFTESFAMNLAYSQVSPDDQTIPNFDGGGHIELENEAVTLGGLFRF